jgi:5'-nucleotidase
MQQKKNILIPNIKELNKKIDLIKKEGPKNLHILSDFDRTITRAFIKNKKMPSIVSHLRNGNYLSKDYAEKAHALYAKYHPIEISSTIPQNEKNKAMVEWWSNHYNLFAESGLNNEIITRAVNDMISESTIQLREGSKEFFQLCNKKQIPIIILSSSGIGNMVLEFLNAHKLMTENVHFIGNTLEFDKKNIFQGIKDKKVIHIFNKHEAELKNLPIYEKIKDRKNIILLGDSMGDLGMLEGLNHRNVIKIGFHNDPEENLEDFKKNFDIVITNDSGFESINQLLKQLLENKT